MRASALLLFPLKNYDAGRKRLERFTLLAPSSTTLQREQAPEESVLKKTKITLASNT